MSSFRRIADLDLQGAKVFVRVDFNVPLDEQGAITEDTRIQAALPTLRALVEAGARVVLASHLGRPKGAVVESMRMAPVAARLSELLERPVRGLPEWRGPAVAEAVAALKDGELLLLENVRFDPGETAGDEELASEWASMVDAFVGDAFGTAHRAHASVTGVAARLPAERRAAGLLMERELEAFARITTDPARPFVAVLGGAKVSDKILVVQQLLERVDGLIIGGGMAYTFLKARGIEVGASKLEAEQLDVARAALAKAEQRGVELLLPVDHVCAAEFSAEAAAVEVAEEAIPDGLMALDIGPRTRERFCEKLRTARTVMWNGPLGVFEWEAFAAGSEAVARAIADSDSTSVVGGGDSLAVIKKYGLGGRFGHVSTGGGAFLEMLEGKTLPGVAVLSPT